MGGYVTTDSQGRDVFCIRKQIGGKRFDVSTRCHTERAALEQLKKFEADPLAYKPGGDPKALPLLLDDDLAKEFLVWSRDVKRNSAEWLAKQRRYLSWWSGRFHKIDLRRVSLVDHIKPSLKGEGNTQHRIAVLKAFYSWLRKEKHALTLMEDPTFQTLAVPQARPQQWKKDKVILIEHYQLAREHIAPHWRDGMDVQAGTGWHVTELVRFAKTGSIERHPRANKDVAGVLVCPQSKAGEPLRTPVSVPVVEAAKRLLERGDYSRERYGMAVNGACRAAGIPKFSPGRFRHSVATWAMNNDADPASVAAFLGHKSPRTTKRFYAAHAVPKKVPTLL